MKQNVSRGNYWFDLLTGQQAQKVVDLAPSVRAADSTLHEQLVRYIAVVPDANNPFPRAREGEVGLIEGWSLAKVVEQTITLDKDNVMKRPIIAVIDVASQAYGRREEAYGIHLALAGAASAYAKARLEGHPIVGLIVGKAMSGAFLAHGYQANCLIAFDDPKVMVHAMGKAAAARITLRSVEELEKLADTVPPMAYDIKRYASLGLLRNLLTINNPDEAKPEDVEIVKQTLIEAISDIRQEPTKRLLGDERTHTAQVRELMKKVW